MAMVVRRFPGLFVLGIAATLVRAAAVPEQAGAARPPAIGRPDEVGGYASTHIIVRCSGETLKPGAAAAAAFQDLGARWGVRHCQRAYPFEFGDPELAAELGIDRTFVLEVPPGVDAPAMAAAYAALPGVEAAELDGVGGVAMLIPNDPEFPKQWNMHNTGQIIAPGYPPGLVDCDVDAPEAWMIHTGVGGDVVIAIVDSGVDPHEEYADRLLSGINTNDPENPNLTGTTGCAHGNHVTGIAAAEGNNARGVAGMHWGAKILPVRVVGDDCTGTESQCANGIVWAVDHGADIINLSLQYYTGTQTLRNAVDYATARGVLMIGAAGNYHPEVVAYPARFDSVIAVSAITNQCARAPFSNYGLQVDVAAPGEKIWSTWTVPSYVSLSGTSMAAPHVGGLAALLKSYRPELSTGRIRNLILTTADDLGDPGWDESFGFGRINAARALEAAGRTVGIVGSNPPNDAIDARQPSNMDGTNVTGWQTVELVFDGEAFRVTPEEFAVTVEDQRTEVPVVIDIAPIARDTVTVVLSKPIPVGAWTTITHIESGTSVRLGYLPGDVNRDGTTTVFDILALIDAINAPGSRPVSSTDIDRSTVVGSSDIIRLIDLLNGAGEYEPYLGMSLP